MQISASKWVACTMIAVGLCCAFVVSFSYLQDPFGLWLNSPNRDLRVFDFERKAKFFLSERYVPDNFSGLLAGSSNSANWDVPPVDGIRIYNESLPGGNAAEEQILIGQTLKRSHMKLAVFLLTPSMTSGYYGSGARDGLDSTKNVESLGSIQSLYYELTEFLSSRHVRFRKSHATGDGKLELPYSSDLGPVVLQPTYFHIDPHAISIYRNAILSLKMHGALIVYVVPPVYQPTYERYRLDFDDNLAQMESELPPAAIINFCAPEYIAFRSSPDNFIDSFHLQERGAAQISAELHTRLEAYMKTVHGWSTH